jgi:hypothetical protein
MNIVNKMTIPFVLFLLSLSAHSEVDVWTTTAPNGWNGPFPSIVWGVGLNQNDVAQAVQQTLDYPTGMGEILKVGHLIAQCSTAGYYAMILPHGNIHAGGTPAGSCGKKNREGALKAAVQSCKGKPDCLSGDLAVISGFDSGNYTYNGPTPLGNLRYSGIGEHILTCNLRPYSDSPGGQCYDSDARATTPFDSTAFINKYK